MNWHERTFLRSFVSELEKLTIVRLSYLFFFREMNILYRLQLKKKKNISTGYQTNPIFYIVDSEALIFSFGTHLLNRRRCILHYSNQVGLTGRSSPPIQYCYCYVNPIAYDSLKLNSNTAIKYRTIEKISIYSQPPY